MSNFVTNKDILTRLENLERAFMQAQLNNVNTVAKADSTKGINQRVDNLSDEVADNTNAIEETNIGLMETYEETSANASSIDELELALEEVYEMIM